MAEVEVSIRDQINRDLNCTSCALQLMSLRRELKLLISASKAVGEGDCLSNFDTWARLRPFKKEGKLARVILFR